MNNAGYYQMGPLEGTSIEQAHRQYQTNVFSIAALIKAFLPTFRAQHSGMIINIASLTAEQGYPYSSIYASSKAAVALLSESLNIELAEFGVIVRVILPGMSATRIFTKIDRGDSIPDAPGAYLLWAAALLLKAIADDAPGDQDASAVALVRDLGLAEPDRALYPALIRVAHGLFERRAGQGITEATLVGEMAGLLGEVKRSAPTSRGPAWPGERLTDSETRVLRYLPTHLGAAEIAAELYLSANTVKTHLRHLYRKLGAHSRQEAVQRARAVGLLTGSSRRL